MKNKTGAFFGAVALVAGLFPALALAHTEEQTDMQLQTAAGLHTDLEDHEVSSHLSGTETESIGENDGQHAKSEHSDMHSTSTAHKESDLSEDDNDQFDEDDNEIDMDQSSVDEASSTIADPEQVGNLHELRDFINHLLEEDDQIDDVHVSSSTIETHYDTAAKLFGAIPMELTATITVHSDGSVSVTYPWYAFLFAKHEDLQEALDHAVSANGTAAVSSSVSAQAHMLDRIFSILRG